MNATDHDTPTNTPETTTAHAAPTRSVRRHSRHTVAAAILGLFALPLTGCSDVDDAEREAIEALATIPHIRILEVRTGSILPVFSPVDIDVDLRLEEGADLRTACETALSTMTEVMARHDRSLQSLTIKQEVTGIDVETGRCEPVFVESSLTVQRAMLPHLSSGSELDVYRPGSGDSVAVMLRGGPADTHAIDAVKALEEHDVNVWAISVLPDTGESWSFSAGDGSGLVLYLEALLASGVVPLEVDTHSGSISDFVQVTSDDLEVASAVPVPQGLRNVVLTDLDRSDWYASQQPSPTS